MKSISLTVPDVMLTKAKKVAKEKKTSLPALLRGYLRDLTTDPVGLETARERLRQLSATATGEVGPRMWKREDLY
jgi:hypothetical protein